MNKLAQRLNFIEAELNQVDQRLQQIVEAASPEINDVGNYIFNGAGKRIRPTLFLLAASQSQKSSIPHLDAAVALEMIHTASLLHDDVIDQASTRRGKEAVHVKWNNKISVLTGDYFLSQAIEILASTQDWRLMDVVIEIIRNMAEGEMEQAFADPAMPDLEKRYFSWIGKKSASFFAGCCKAGALIRDVDYEEQDKWSDFGFNLGIAFQLIDDLLDYTGKNEFTGKPVFGDLNNRVLTLPLIRTREFARRDGFIHRVLETKIESDHQLSEVVQAVLDSDGPRYTYQKAEEYIKRANEVIEEMRGTHSLIKEALKGLTRDVLDRKK